MVAEKRTSGPEKAKSSDLSGVSGLSILHNVVAIHIQYFQLVSSLNFKVSPLA